MIRFVVIGLLSGLAMAGGVARLVSAMLFGLAATDATTFVHVAVVVTAVSILACAVPAARAGRLVMSVPRAE
jgi:putative ABC transport system permease protein